MQIILFYLSTWLISIIFYPLMYVTKNVLGTENAGPGMKYWFAGIFIGPVIETFINQAGAFWLFNKIIFFKNKQGLIIIFSAIIFGLLHSYNLGYMIFAFSIGLVLAFAYCFYYRNLTKAFWPLV